jgi:hypothetical protein
MLTRSLLPSDIPSTTEATAEALNNDKVVYMVPKKPLSFPNYINEAQYVNI